MIQLDIRNSVEKKYKITVSMISSVHQLHSYDTALYQKYKYQTQFKCVERQTYGLDDIKCAPVALSHPHCPPVNVTVVLQQGVGEPGIFMFGSR